MAKGTILEKRVLSNMSMLSLREARGITFFKRK
jgi:hypothetical protein